MDELEQQAIYELELEKAAMAELQAEPHYYAGPGLPKTFDELTPEQKAFDLNAMGQRRKELALEQTQWERLANPLTHVPSEIAKLIAQTAVAAPIGVASASLGGPIVGGTVGGAAGSAAAAYVGNKFDEFDLGLQQSLGTIPNTARGQAYVDELTKQRHQGVGEAAAWGGGLGLATGGIQAALGLRPFTGLTGREQAAELRFAQAKAGEPGSSANVFSANNSNYFQGLKRKFADKYLTDPLTNIPNAISKEDIINKRLAPKILEGVDASSNVSQAAKVKGNIEQTLNELTTARAGLIEQADKVALANGLAKPIQLQDSALTRSLYGNGDSYVAPRFSPSEALSQISKLDDMIKAENGYNPAAMQVLADRDVGSAAQTFERVKEMRALRKELSTKLNDFIGGNQLLDLNQQMSALKNFQPFIDDASSKLSNTSLQPILTNKMVEGGVTTEGNSWWNRGFNLIKDASTYSNDAAVSQLKTSSAISEQGFNRLIRLFDNISKMQRGEQLPIPRYWNLVKNDWARVGPVIGSIAANLGLLQKAEDIFAMAEPMQKKIFTDTARLYPQGFEKTAKGFTSVIDGMFNDPMEREIYRKNVQEADIPLTQKAKIESALNENKFLDYEDPGMIAPKASAAPVVNKPQNTMRMINYLTGDNGSISGASDANETEADKMVKLMSSRINDIDYDSSAY